MSYRQDLLDKIVDVINIHIRPSLQMDGGDISIISLQDNILQIKLYGACSHCSRASETLKYGVEKTLRSLVSDNIQVVAV